jgi:hypothetical protein
MGVSRRDTQLYAVFFDLEPSRRSAWMRWYQERHAPDLLAAGFLGFRAYESVRGTPGFVTIWEQDHDVLQTPAYTAAREGDETLAANESAVRNLRKGTYRQVPLDSAGSSDPGRSEWLAVIGFDLPEPEEPRLTSSLGDVILPAAAGARLAVRLGGHPLFPQAVAPRVLVLVEGPDDPGGLDVLRRGLAEASAPAAAGSLTVARRYGILTR